MNISEFKEKIFQSFLLQKTQLSSILHKKVVQKIFHKYSIPNTPYIIDLAQEESTIKELSQFQSNFINKTTITYIAEDETIKNFPYPALLRTKDIHLSFSQKIEFLHKPETKIFAKKLTTCFSQIKSLTLSIKTNFPSTLYIIAEQLPNLTSLTIITIPNPDLKSALITQYGVQQILSVVSRFVFQIPQLETLNLQIKLFKIIGKIGQSQIEKLWKQIQNAKNIKNFYFYSDCKVDTQALEHLFSKLNLNFQYKVPEENK